ncbi:TPA: MoaD/ThiS family protein, partial [Candidatus Bathyarchaeota archaeon]|nr:MoaD/ThiS family protein [Candidatus Bathyarchaeota archaeon]
MEQKAKISVFPSIFTPPQPPLGEGPLKVKVKYFAILREITNKREEELEVKEGTSVKALLEILAKKYGGRFRNYVFNEKTGSVNSQLLFLVDGVNVASLNKLETKLSDGNSFVIL